MKFSDTKKAYACIAYTTIVFATMEIVCKMIPEYSPLGMSFLRFFIGALILLPFALVEMKKRELKFKMDDHIFFLVTGIIGIAISMSFYQTSLQHTSASLVAVLFGANPIFTAPLAVIVTKEKVSPLKIASLIVCVVGMIFIFNPFGLAADAYGMLLALISAVTFSVYTVMGKKRIARYGGLLMSTFSFLYGTIVLLIGMLITGTPIIGGITAEYIPHVIYIAVVITGLGYLCYFTSMKYVPVTTSSMVFLIKPALSTILSLIILREIPTWNAAVGIILIVLASVAQMFEGKIMAKVKK